MALVTIKEVFDEEDEEMCIELNEFGSITLYPYHDSGERADQLANARHDASHWAGIHTIVDTA